MFRKTLKLWSLEEPEVKEMFAEKVNARCDDNDNWGGLQ